MKRMKSRELLRWTGVAAAVFGIGLMVYGIYRSELEVLFTKAINICLECVGIG